MTMMATGQNFQGSQ